MYTLHSFTIEWSSHSTVKLLVELLLVSIQHVLCPTTQLLSLALQIRTFETLPPEARVSFDGTW